MNKLTFFYNFIDIYLNVIIVYLLLIYIWYTYIPIRPYINII